VFNALAYQIVKPRTKSVAIRQHSTQFSQTISVMLSTIQGLRETEFVQIHTRDKKLV